VEGVELYTYPVMGRSKFAFEGETMRGKEKSREKIRFWDQEEQKRKEISEIRETNNSPISEKREEYARDRINERQAKYQKLCREE